MTLMITMVSWIMSDCTPYRQFVRYTVRYCTVRTGSVNHDLASGGL